MYRLILRANTPTAEQFQEWVTAEVLPAIRRTGSYTVPQQAPPADVSSVTKRDLARMILEEADRADAAEQRAAELAPAAEAYEVLAGAQGDLSLKDTAAVLSRDKRTRTGQNRLKQFMLAEGLIDRRGRPYVQYTHLFPEKVGTYPHPHTGEPQLYHTVRITPAGLEMLRKRLLQAGVAA
jgi:anti-repressor protein